MTEGFVSLTRPNCGGKLDVYDDMTRFACGYCKSEVLTVRRGGAVMLKTVTERHEARGATDPRLPRKASAERRTPTA